MRLLVKVTLLGVMLMAVSAQAVNQEAQVDILMSKSVRALKENRNADALASMEQLMSMESSLSKPLPEGFEYLYIETLDQAGNMDKALERANKYIDKYGTKSKNYGKVIEIIGRLEEKAELKAEQKQRADIEQCFKIADDYCNYKKKEVYFSKNNDFDQSREYQRMLFDADNRWKRQGCSRLAPSRYSTSIYEPIICN